MFSKGLWHDPLYLYHGTVLLRLVYPEMHEPQIIENFRSRYDNDLPHFTWVPAPVEQQQHVLIRRHWISEEKVFDVEMLVWDQVDDKTTHLYLHGQAFKHITAMLSDLYQAPDVRRKGQVMQDRLAEQSRGEDGWDSLSGTWRGREVQYNRMRKEERSRTRTLKGGAGNN